MIRSAPSRRLLPLACVLALLPSMLLAGNCPSLNQGVGVSPYAGGVSFRVWSPFANTLTIAGTFNGWSSTANPLCYEGNGYWSTDVDGALPGDQYKFVIQYGSQTLWRKDPRGLRVVNSAGNSVIQDPAFGWTDAGTTTPSWDKMVIYEMHIGTFNDTSPANGTPAAFSDAVQKLNVLADLGVNAIEVMPIWEFPGNYSWGYNPSDPYAVESVYGGPDAFKNFVNECHARNIGVLLDVVYNHWGPNDLGLWQFDGWSLNNKGGIYFYQDWRSDTPWGPRPDYGRAEVRGYIRDNAMLWLNDSHVDGLRWDATAYIRNVYGNNNDPANDISDGWYLMQTANDRIDLEQPWDISIAEDMKGNEWLTKTIGSGGAGFDSQWDGGFADAVRAAVEIGSDSQRNMNSVRDALVRKFNNDALDRVIYTESHDAVANGNQRVPSKIDPANPGSYWARKRSTLAAALALTAPGIPMLFQGQEFLEDGWFSDTDPLDWNKTNTYAKIRLLYKDLIKARKNAAGNTRGLSGQNINAHHVNNTDKMIAFHRWDQGGAGDDVIVMANFKNKKYTNYRIGLPRSGTWTVRFNSDSTSYGSDFGNYGDTSVVAQSTPYNGMAFSAPLKISPYSVLILSQ